MITWEQLTAGEQSALSRWINIDREFVNEFEKGLQAKGLIRIVRIDHHRHQNMLTDAGRAVLAQAQAGQPEAEGGGVDYQTMWFAVSKQLAELRVDYNELFKEFEEMPPQFTFDEQKKEIGHLRAQLAASLEREAVLREALEKVKGVSDSYSGADIPHIANPKRALYEAESVFNEIAQALADAGEIAAEALASNGGERGGK